MGRGVFLDRDGVLNRTSVRNGTPYPPRSLDELEILPGVPEALRRLLTHGFRLVVVTNQPDVARGVQERSTVEGLNRALASRLPVHDIRVCYHDDSDHCGCRKPKPGLILGAAGELDLDLDRSYMIGDRWRDVEAGRAAGCQTVLIDRDYSERSRCAPDGIAVDLPDAVDWILQRRDPGSTIETEKGAL